MRTQALEEGDLVAPQVNRVQEARSGSLDVGELNENIEKLTNINMAGPGRRMGPVKCFSCGETGNIACYCRSNVQRPYPDVWGICQCRPGKKTLRAASEKPATVKLDK